MTEQAENVSTTKQSQLDNLQDLKKTRWEAFCKKYAARIAVYPSNNGRKVIPAMWVDAVQDYIWISRKHRRHIERKSRR